MQRNILNNHSIEEKSDSIEKYSFTAEDISSLKLLDEHSIYNVDSEFVTPEVLDPFMVPSKADIKPDVNSYGLFKDINRDVTIHGRSFTGILNDLPVEAPLTYLKDQLDTMGIETDLDALARLHMAYTQGPRGFMIFVYTHQFSMNDRSFNYMGDRETSSDITFVTENGITDVFLKVSSSGLLFQKETDTGMDLYQMDGRYELTFKVETRDDKTGFMLQSIHTDNLCIAEICRGNAQYLMDWNSKRAEFSDMLAKYAGTLKEKKSDKHPWILSLSNLLKADRYHFVMPEEILERWITGWNQHEIENGRNPNPQALFTLLARQDSYLGLAVRLFRESESITLVGKIFPKELLEQVSSAKDLTFGI